MSATDLKAAPRHVRRRVLFTGFFRTMIVVAVIAALAYALVSVVVSGPPSPPDPLSISTSYTIAPGAYALLSGEITGGDYVVGHFQSVSPAGASIEVAVYNSSNWGRFVNGTPTAPEYTLGPEASAEIVYSAPYTDTYYFLFENPYPMSSGLNVTVDVVTQYESNVGDDGFS